ncbi:sensor histidine kinase [Bacillus fonticola]|uniref:sensor histidine kinase n=1 Tax=Bacillus fonticola TaxID=2728853 RepID=UPI001472A6A4|nr:sensor histidine kinase [Bacillus fonticola]
MTRYLYVLLLVVLFLPGSEVGANYDFQPQNGIVDLTGWNEETDAVFPLKGQWELYWGKLLEPTDFSSTISFKPSYVMVPNPWSTYETKNQNISNKGYATYRLRIQLPTILEERTLALRIPSIATSYKLWINKELQASNGVVGKTAEEMVPTSYSKVIYFQPESNQLDVVIQVSNFVQRKGGIWDSLTLGTEEQLSYQQNISYMYEIFIVGSLLIMAFFYLFHYLTRRKERASLYFGGVCALIAIRTLFVGQGTAYYLFPMLSWEIGVKLEYIAPFGSLLLLVLFINSQYPDLMKMWFVRLLQWSTGILVLFVVVVPAVVYTEVLFLYFYGIATPTILYILYIYLLAAKQKREGSLLNLIGLGFLSATIMSDILYYSYLTNVGDLIPLGVLIYLFTQSINLAVKYSKAFANVERLSRELSILNESLEEKIKERTVDLQRMNSELEQANLELSRKEEFRQRLFANITHEIMTPLTSLKGYIMAIIDRIVPSNDPKYWTILKDKTLFLEHMMEDLFELTKLETRQIPFDFEDVEVIPYFQQLYQKYELPICHNVNFTVQNNVDTRILGNIDSVRIEQVFSNLLKNAQKFTPPTGTITVRLEIQKIDDKNGIAKVEIADTGSGISDSELGNIFERYYRSATIKRNKSSGVGLGLAICKEIIAYHHGTIGAESEKGKGSTFYFSLPVQF